MKSTIEVDDSNIDELVNRFADAYLSSKSIGILFGIHRNNLSRWGGSGEVRKIDSGQKASPRGCSVLYNAADAIITRWSRKRVFAFKHVTVNGIDLYRCNGCHWWTGRGGYYQNPSERAGAHGLLTKCRDCHNKRGRAWYRKDGVSEEKRLDRNRRRQEEYDRAVATRKWKAPVWMDAARVVEIVERKIKDATPREIEIRAGLPEDSYRSVVKSAKTGGKTKIAGVERLFVGLELMGELAEINNELEQDRPPWHPKWPYCQRCYRTNREHIARGMCVTCYKHRNEPDYVPMLEPTAWSQRHIECVVCHRTDSRHAAHGQCHRCHQRLRKRGEKAANEVSSGHGNPRSIPPHQ